jgi:hypothetical protein
VFGALAGAGAVLVVDEQVPPVGAGHSGERLVRARRHGARR